MSQQKSSPESIALVQARDRFVALANGAHPVTADLYVVKVGQNVKPASLPANRFGQIRSRRGMMTTFRDGSGMHNLYLSSGDEASMVRLLAASDGAWRAIATLPLGRQFAQRMWTAGDAASAWLCFLFDELSPPRSVEVQWETSYLRVPVEAAAEKDPLPEVEKALREIMNDNDPRWFVCTIDDLASDSILLLDHLMERGADDRDLLRHRATHSADFTFVNWFGTEYRFALGVQSRAVKALWEEWERSGLGLHQETIRDALDPERDNFRMDKTFRKHPAMGTMIRSAGDGTYRLVNPLPSRSSDPSESPRKPG
jgi:hypothetical protein